MRYAGAQGVLERLAAAVGVPLGGGADRRPAAGAVANAVVGSGRQRQLLERAIGGIARAGRGRARAPCVAAAESLREGRVALRALSGRAGLAWGSHGAWSGASCG